MSRVGIAGLWHETNTYSIRRTELSDFEAFERLAGHEIIARHTGTRTVIGGMLDRAAFEVVPLVTAGAWPAGRVAADALAALLEGLERALLAAGPLDGILLDLHGAMVAEGAADVEAEALRLVRRVAGDVPLAVGSICTETRRRTSSSVATSSSPTTPTRTSTCTSEGSRRPRSWRSCSAEDHSAR